MKSIILAGAAAIAVGSGAQAVTFLSAAGAPDPGPAAGETVLFDFSAPTPELSGMFQLVTGTVAGQYAAPAGDATQYAVVPTAGLPNGSATLDLSGVANPIATLSLYWGSIDTYNTLEFLNGTDVFFSINGSQLPPANGDQGDGLTNRRVYFTLGAGESLTALRFVSDGVAFEFDDVAVSAVPEPESWMLMIAGFGLIGVAARRRGMKRVAA